MDECPNRYKSSNFGEMFKINHTQYIFTCSILNSSICLPPSVCFYLPILVAADIDKG